MKKKINNAKRHKEITMMNPTRYITREQFEAVRPLLENARKKTRPRKHDLYDVLCAILDRRATGKAWRALPDALLPAATIPWRTIHEYGSLWRVVPAEGGQPLLAQVLAKLGMPVDMGQL